MRLKSFLLKDPIAQYFPKMGKSKTADVEYTKPEFLKALGRFNELLAEKKQHITFLCVGGGMMTLVLGARNATHDLDGVLQKSNPELEKLFHSIAAQVAEELHMEPDWINLQVKPLLQEQGYKPSFFEPSGNYSWSNLKMLFAKPGYMLATKCHALRIGRKDFRDVVVLIQKLGIKTIEALEQEVSQYVDWGFIGNDEIPLLKLAIAWAFPNQTEYEYIRAEALNRYKGVKQKQPLQQAA